MCEDYKFNCNHPFFEHQHFVGRRFLAKEEVKGLKERYNEKRIKWLEHYKESLEAELKGVKERLEEVRKD